MKRLFWRGSTILAPCALGACWLAASFDGLTTLGGTDASPDDASMEAALDGTPGDAGTDTSDAPTSDAPSSDTPGPDVDAGPDGDASPSADASCVSSTTYRESVLAERPLAYWRLDEDAGATANDSSGNGHTGTYTGGVTLAAAGALVSDPDTAASFNGTDGLVNMSTVFPFLSQTPFSLEAWIYPTNVNGEYRGIVSNESTTPSPRFGYLMWIESPGGAANDLGFERWDGSASNPTKASGIGAANQWYHVVGTFSGSAITLYVNGVQKDQATTSIVSIAEGNTFLIGALYSGAMPSNFQGTIDEVAVYDHALDPTCVVAHHHLGSGM